MVSFPLGERPSSKKMSNCFKSLDSLIQKFVRRARYRIYASQRKIDIDILWPACKCAAEQRGEGIEDARRAFLWHALSEPAWIEVFQSGEIFDLIWKLE